MRLGDRRQGLAGYPALHRLRPQAENLSGKPSLTPAAKVTLAAFLRKNPMRKSKIASVVRSALLPISDCNQHANRLIHLPRLHLAGGFAIYVLLSFNCLLSALVAAELSRYRRMILATCSSSRPTVSAMTRSDSLAT